MCLATPLKIIKVISSEEAIAEFNGISKSIDISLLKNLKSGDYILVHEGLGIQKMDKESAGEIIMACECITKRMPLP